MDENLIVEVDKELRFSRYFNPIQESRQEAPRSYKPVVVAIIAMSNSTDELSVDILRDVVRICIHEETTRQLMQRL